MRRFAAVSDKCADLAGVTLAGGGLAGAIAAQQRTNSADEVGKGCMAQKGYVYVAEDKAEEISASLGATAAQRNALSQGPGTVQQTSAKR
jgi:hypothetical protein